MYSAKREGIPLSVSTILFVRQDELRIHFIIIIILKSKSCRQRIRNDAEMTEIMFETTQKLDIKNHRDDRDKNHLESK